MPAVDAEGDMMLEPVTLEGRHVRLEPLTRAHIPALCEVGLDEELWRWTTTQIRTPADMAEYIEAALSAHAGGMALPFAIVERRSGRVVGSTRLANIDRENRHAEIGWTWVSTRWQRSAVNTEAKYLLLCFAFDVSHCIRVELKTDVLNAKSRAAIERIGARQEGIFRNHMITETGRYRDSVYYSIIEAEWPDIKASLAARLTRVYTEVENA